MNTTLFKSICDLLESEVPALRWIDGDMGQLEDGRPGIAYPCALIDITYPSCADVDSVDQQINADISVRVAFDPRGATNAAVSTERRDSALSMLDTLEDIHRALQGFTDDYVYSSLSRYSALREKRADGRPVYRIVYKTTFLDTAP